MDRRTAAIAMVALLALTAGCAAPAAQTDRAHNSRDSLDWAGTYRGVVPCADCEGIETALSLMQDGKYVLRTRYLGKSTEIRMSEGTFRWNAGGSAVTLSGSPPTQYQVGENRLTQLGLDGKTVTGNLADKYVLAKMSDEITEKYWKLVELRGQPVPKLPREPHLILKIEGNRVTGTGGCNGFTGTYTLDKAALRIRFSQVASTMMACVQGMDTEQSFHEVLGMVDNYSLAGDHLSLNRARMAPLARFEAVYLR